jgi:hypothetical protein
VSPDAVSTRPLLDKLGVKVGSRVAVVSLDEPWFVDLLRQRTQDIARRRPAGPVDLVFFGVRYKADLGRLGALKAWIEPDGAIWVVRAKGPRATVADTELIQGGLAAGLVDNKIASFSDSQGAMRFVFRLRDRPKRQ